MPVFAKRLQGSIYWKQEEKKPLEFGSRWMVFSCLLAWTVWFFLNERHLRMAYVNKRASDFGQSHTGFLSWMPRSSKSSVQLYADK